MQGATNFGRGWRGSSQGNIKCGGGRRGGCRESPYLAEGDQGLQGATWPGITACRCPDSFPPFMPLQSQVAITDQHSPAQAASPSPSRSSPAPRTPTTPSSFAPANVPSLEGGSASVRSLWELNAASGVITWQQQVTSRQQAQQQGQSQQPQQDGQPPSSSSSLSSPPWAYPTFQDGQRLGHFVLPASVWPLQKLPRGSVALSPTLLEICGGGRLAAGTVLALFAAPGKIRSSKMLMRIL